MNDHDGRITFQVYGICMTCCILNRGLLPAPSGMKDYPIYSVSSEQLYFKPYFSPFSPAV